MSKKYELIPAISTEVSNNTSNGGTKVESLIDKIEKSNDKISKGLSNPTASTGTPIEKLGGGAKFMAQLSNIGGGSLKVGGGGIKDGFNTVMQNVDAKSEIKETLKNANKNSSQNQLSATERF